MGKDLAENFPVARKVFEEVDSALSQKLSELMFSGDDADLNLTTNTQPAIMSVCVAISRVIAKESGKNLYEISKDFAGHSLGEFSALCAAEAISLADTAKLLRIRGDAMQSAVPSGKGRMVALIGGEIEKIEELAKLSSEHGVCEIANDNGAGQFVLSGEVTAIEHAAANAKEFGVRKAVPLKVSAPFHCSLIKSAGVELAQALAGTNITTQKNNCYSNVDTEYYRDQLEIKSKLEKQVTSRVRWREIMHKLQDDCNVNTFIEIGPGRVLSTLAKRELDGITVGNVGDSAGIDEFLKQYC